VVIWDLATGRPPLTLKGHTTNVRDVSFSADGQRLASGDADKAVVWDLLTAQPALALQGPGGKVTSVSFSPDGRRLAGGLSDGTLIVWETDNRHLWHLREASAAEDQGHWDNAARHLESMLRKETAVQAADALSGVSPPLPLGAVATLLALRQREGRVELNDLLERHHRACLELGRWKDAEADFHRLQSTGADTPDLWHRRAWGMLYQEQQQEMLLRAVASVGAVPPLGSAPGWRLLPLWPRRPDTKAFRRVCDEMTRRFPAPKDAGTADTVAWTRLLVGDGFDREQLARLEKLARFAVDSQPDSAVYRETYGAALYRAGKFKDAVEQLKIAVEKDGSVWQQTFLAMSHHLLGNRKEARDWLTRAVRQIEQKRQKEKPGWLERVEWNYLRQEAEATLGWVVPPPPGRK
jgi:tetratricopeptide (TPR) repeat protein